jgi:hypothetical protein
LDYAAEHVEEILQRIEHNRAMARRSIETSRQREALLT